jgi:hypothetical protein
MHDAEPTIVIATNPTALHPRETAICHATDTEPPNATIRDTHKMNPVNSIAASANRVYATNVVQRFLSGLSVIGFSLRVDCTVPRSMRKPPDRGLDFKDTVIHEMPVDPAKAYADASSDQTVQQALASRGEPMTDKPDQRRNATCGEH